MDHLQTDIDSLESEKGQLKEKLKSIGKKGATATTPGAEGPSIVGTIATSTTAVVGAPMEEGTMHEKINALREALKDESRQKRMLLSENMQKKLDSMAPLPRLDAKPEEDAKIKALLQKKTELLRVSRSFVNYWNIGNEKIVANLSMLPI